MSLFRSRWFYYRLEENICSIQLYSASQLFCDSLSSDNIACSKPSAGKTKSPISGAIVTAERKKLRLESSRVKSFTRLDLNRPGHDPTRPDPSLPCFFSPPLLSRHAPFSLGFPKWKPLNKKACNKNSSYGPCLKRYA